ncbi:MAG TPA: response regulator, partial [Polyangiales bacterium]
IVKQLVELHGGSVSAESDGLNQGTTFQVRLPLDVPGWAGDESDDRITTPSTAAAAMQHCVRGLRVLVVEDDADSRELVERLLEEAGCHVSTAACAREALDHLSHEFFDLLISDIGLPDQDGYALLAGLRQRTEPRVAHMPAVALTAFARSEDRARALRAGFQAHLAKPVDPAELLATVNSFAGLVSTQRSA